ncbi:hypothetical protein BD414DRAFT_534221 [Trametes punicea]|nr:hypothetical protein BD414DRAFT_534221 [Trametes punicea]
MSKADKETLKAALQGLQSDKETVRAQAVKDIRYCFSRRSAIARFDQDKNGRAWLVLFQALFQAYKAQLKKCISKMGSLHDLQGAGTSNVSVRRLSDIADTIRSLAVRSKERLNTRVLKALLTHLTDAITYEGKLVSLVASEYAQTIGVLLSWKPHLQALPDDMWHSLLGIAFNVVLGRPPRRTLKDGLDILDLNGSPVEFEGASDDEPSQSTGPDTTAGPSRLTKASSLKRQRHSTQPAMSSDRHRHLPSSTAILRPSPEQLEFMTVVAILLSSPTAPILSAPADSKNKNAHEDPYSFSRKLLSYFSCFLRTYPPDSSLRLDYLSALSAALRQYTINCRLPVMAFATESWQSLVALWRTKDVDKSEDIVVVLRMLFPVLTAEPIGDNTGAIAVESLEAFWSTAEVIANKRSSPGLRLDSLQLKLSPDHTRASRYPFVTGTFEHGWRLDQERALAWATCELQADCAEKLYLHTESTYPTATVGRKRIKLENPIVTLLQSIRSQTRSQLKIHHLQVLLFFVDRHWLVLHEQLRRDVVVSLTSLLSFEDVEVQSWTFLCLAAIAHAEGLGLPNSASQHPSASEIAGLWDPVWTHAMRRANVPAVSRAASHAAHVLLLHSKRLLSSQRVLSEIESFVKDLDVQGPAYPYDSVCSFMILCLRFANQDVRLYRMQMEEKVLSWLTEAWRIDVERRTTMPMQTVAHVHSLLEAITGTSKRVQLRCDIMLPPSVIVDALVEESQTKVIRDFQLHAHLPAFKPALSPFGADFGSLTNTTEYHADDSLSQHLESVDLAPPRGRERRVSAFLLKLLEATSGLLVQSEEGQSRKTAENLRHALDLAVISLFFEASLLLNGTQSNRRVIQAACRLISLIYPTLMDERWEVKVDNDSDESWEALVPPGERTGIRTQVLRELLSTSTASSNVGPRLRRDLQRCVFRSADVQDMFSELLVSLRDVLRMTVDQVSKHNPYVVVDDQDDFGPVGHAAASASAPKTIASLSTHHGHVTRACVTALVIVPILRSSGESTHDKELMDLFVNCDPVQFLVLAPPCLEHIGRGRLRLNCSNFESLLERLDELCIDHVFKHNEEAQLVVVRTLEATSHLWRGAFSDKEVGEKARYYASQCVKRLRSSHQRSWRVRDAIIRFLHQYLVSDPTQEIWAQPNAEGESPAPEDLPAAVLPTLGNDDDIRIRFRIAATSSHLFTVGRLAGRPPLDVYKEIHINLSITEEHFERILTRLVCLGNVVISDASVRRGAYWHLLEIAFYSNTYRRHLKAVLMGITTRLGMERFSDLFNCYASQFAYSIRRSNIDVLRFPYDLLGYRDRRECAEATFRAFTPTNLLAAGTVEEITLWLDYHSEIADQKSVEDKLEDVLKAKTRLSKDEPLFYHLFKQRVDDIVVAILRTLGDQDVSGDGPIVAALRQVAADGAAETFLAITKYRALDTFEAYEPNLPRYGSHIVLRALEWYQTHVETADSRAVTYHVLHNLFSDIERSPLVNEQYRSLSALCLWISRHHEHFKDEILLRVLIRRTVAIFAQSDLARSAQSLLEWSLSLYKTYVTKADYRLADVLIRVSTIAHEHSEANNSPSSSLAKLGSQLMTWVESQAEMLHKSKFMRKQVNRALVAWPRELPPSLCSACDDLQLDDLKSALGDRGITSSKFRLVRRIYEVASHGKHEDDQGRFESYDFWRLKACIPPEDHLVDSDIDAFTSLLLLHHGRFDSLGIERFSSETVCSRHRKLVESKAGPSKEIPPRAEIDLAHTATILSLLAMLDTAPTPQVYTAYATLRALMSTSSDDLVNASVSSDVRHELGYLCAFPRPQEMVSAPELASLLASDDLKQLSSDFSAWITHVTTVLCEFLGSRSLFFSPLSQLLRSDYAFAEEMLPLLVHSLLQIEHDELGSVTLPSLRDLLSQYFSSVLGSEDTTTSVHRAIINVVLHLRCFRPSRDPNDALAHDKWLAVDFYLLSRCAIKCGAYTTALLFLELAHEYSYEPTNSQTSSTEDILFDIYSHIDEPDGFYGIQTDDLRNLFVKRLRHERQWDKAFRYHGAVLESGEARFTDTDGIVQALYSFGFNHLALTTMQNLSDPSQTMETSRLAYNLGWRAEAWDLPENVTEDHSSATLYLAMRAVYRERNQRIVDSTVQRAFTHEMNRLRHLGNENLTEIRQVTQNLMCLSQIRQWRHEVVPKDLQSSQVNMLGWLRNFATLGPEFDFSDIEAVMATRISLVHSLRQKEQRDQIGDLRSTFHDTLVDLEKSCLLCLSERARNANETQVALNSVVRAQSLEHTPSWRVSWEYSNVLWMMKESKLAIKSLSALVAPSGRVMFADDSPSTLQRATLLAQLGTWSAEASMKKPSQIVDECFGPSTALILAEHLEPIVGTENSAASVFHQYAIFAERQYHAISKSPDALRWKLYIDRKREEIKQRAIQLKRMQTNTREYYSLAKQQEHAETLLKQDQERAQEHLGQRTSFLSLAVEMYSRCLSASDSFDDSSPIRLGSLWLANFDNDDSTLRFEDALDRVPSRKFVFLAHQLTARLWNSEQAPPSRNQTILQGLIQRMCREHPFHTLYPLYCIRADRSPSHPSSSRRQSGRHATQSSSQGERGAAAADIFNKLRSDSQSADRIEAVEMVCDASLQWAKHPIKTLFAKYNKRPPKTLPVPEDLLIRHIKDVKVPVITAHTPIDPTTQYRDCAWISHFDSQYTTAGGVNLPKIIRCYSTNGKPYKQLYKGEGDDDLRQDAVMEQVFDLVNVVLRRDRETKRRKLSVRGYKVIPLAAQAGVLEFVENTTRLADWLRLAHPRYRPQDISQDQVNKRLAGSQKREWREHPEKVIERFIQIREQFRPVMRHWFTEKHKTPMAWYAMRLNYARSVATNSIVGHILGVGDRHTSNILIDNKTGEVVHIDLGIAFEQGKLLPQPERVPFRLTADMVDGLGMSGTQGVFQRCAEETLRVLRDGSEIILTVLEVFKYDPLHSWTASELKIKRVQESVPDETAQLTGEAFRFAIGIDMASGAADEAADRALSTVARKLDKTLSVEYTVNELITEASDPANLALMYVGWAPHW